MARHISAGHVDWYVGQWNKINNPYRHQKEYQAKKKKEVIEAWKVSSTHSYEYFTHP